MFEKNWQELMDAKVEGKYKYIKTKKFIYFVPDGVVDEKEYVQIRPYIASPQLKDEGDDIYEKRISDQLNKVFGEIDESKKRVDKLAKKYSIDNTFEIADTIWTFISALKRSKSADKENAWNELMVNEITESLVGKINGFDISEILGKYGPSLNAAIFHYSKDKVLSQGDLYYMYYLMKKNNILNAIACQVMEDIMVSGIKMMKKSFVGFITGLGIVISAGPISDTIKGKIDDLFFKKLDEKMDKYLHGDISELNSEDIFKDLTDVMLSYYKEEGDFIRTGLFEIMNDSINNFKKRYDIYHKIFGQEIAFEIYEMDLGSKKIDLILENKIDGPGILYGMGNALTQTLSIFSEQAKRAMIKKPFKNSLLTTAIVNGNVYYDLEFLELMREKFVITDDVTVIESINYIHGKKDDMKLFVEKMTEDDKDYKLPNLIIYFGENGENNFDDYIKEYKTSNSTSDSPIELSYSIIRYQNLDEDESRKRIDKAKIISHIEYANDFINRIKYTECFKKDFPILYDKSDCITLVQRNALLGNSSIFLDIYGVVKITLKEIAEMKGLIAYERLRGRLGDDEEYIGGLYQVDYIIENYKNMFNNDKIVEISPRGEYIILQRMSNNLYNRYSNLTSLVDYKNANEVRDLIFPDEEYIETEKILYGSSSPKKGDQIKELSYFIGMDSNYDDINPDSKIKINNEEIGCELKRVIETDSCFSDTRNIIEFEEKIESINGNIFKEKVTIRYIYDTDEEELTIKYGLKNKISFELLIEGFNNEMDNEIKIEGFVNGDYGISFFEKIVLKLDIDEVNYYEMFYNNEDVTPMVKSFSRYKKSKEYDLIDFDLEESKIGKYELLNNDDETTYVDKIYIPTNSNVYDYLKGDYFTNKFNNSYFFYFRCSTGKSLEDVKTIETNPEMLSILLMNRILEKINEDLLYNYEGVEYGTIMAQANFNHFRDMDICISFLDVIYFYISKYRSTFKEEYINKLELLVFGMGLDKLEYNIFDVNDYKSKSYFKLIRLFQVKEKLINPNKELLVHCLENDYLELVGFINKLTLDFIEVSLDLSFEKFTFEYLEWYNSISIITIGEKPGSMYRYLREFKGSKYFSFFNILKKAEGKTRSSNKLNTILEGKTYKKYLSSRNGLKYKETVDTDLAIILENSLDRKFTDFPHIHSFIQEVISEEENFEEMPKMSALNIEKIINGTEGEEVSISEISINDADTNQSDSFEMNYDMFFNWSNLIK